MPRQLVLRRVQLALVTAATLAGAAWVAVTEPAGAATDIHLFAAAGRTMLSPQWWHAYANPDVQAGPFELATAARVSTCTPSGVVCSTCGLYSKSSSRFATPAVRPK